MTGTVAIGELLPDDVPALARLHRRAFPEFFLSRLGEPFLREFYAGHLGDPTAVTVVARDEDGVCGCVVGTLHPAGFYARLLRRRVLGFAAASLRAALRHPSFAPRLLAAVRYRGDAPPDGAHGALLSSVCVDPRAQGSGLGGRLVTAWLEQARRAGATVVFLTTDRDGNDQVNDFYSRRGWVLHDRFTTAHGRAMNRYRYDWEDRS